MAAERASREEIADEQKKTVKLKLELNPEAAKKIDEVMGKPTAVLTVPGGCGKPELIDTGEVCAHRCRRSRLCCPD